MKTVIMVSGLARSGKDTVSDYMLQKMAERGISASRLAFAQPMKDILADTFDISLEKLDEYKNNSEQFTFTLLDTEFGYKELITNIRKVLQRFGTEGMKKQFGDDVWVELAHKKLHTDFTIISDWRFKSEYEYFMRQPDVKVISIKVQGNMNTNTEDLHISERDLLDFSCRHTIINMYNNWSFTEKQIDDIVESLSYQSNLDLRYELTPEIDYFKCLKKGD